MRGPHAAVVSRTRMKETLDKSVTITILIPDSETDVLAMHSACMVISHLARMNRLVIGEVEIYICLHVIYIASSTLVVMYIRKKYDSRLYLYTSRDHPRIEARIT